MFDVFICHASEDKKPFVDALAIGLSNAGISVWYDDYVINWGDSLRQVIDKGLAQSKIGLVIFSHSFFNKKWTQSELDGLFGRELHEGKIIFPIWHKISENEIRNYSPILSGKKAITSESSLDFIISQINKALNPGQLPNNINSTPMNNLDTSQITSDVFLTDYVDSNRFGNVVTEVKLGVKFFVYTKWFSVKPNITYRYRIKLFDGAGKIVWDSGTEFKPSNYTYSTWSGYTSDSRIHKPGDWKAEVYLQDRKFNELVFNVKP